MHVGDRIPGVRPDTPVLVVDDSPAIRKLMEVYLTRLGFPNVRAAGTVEEALEVFREQGSEIVFADMVMGDDEGAGASFVTQALAERPLVDVVVITALPPSHELVRASVSQGARDVLPKPVRVGALRDVLDRLARERADRGDGAEDATYA